MGSVRFVLPLILAGCTATIVPDPVTGDTAHAMFEQQVAPLLAGQCVTCHYTGSNLLPLTYASITTNPELNGNYYPEAAELVTKGYHEGPGWTATETAAIVEWLYAEAAARM
jgi:hypothetical protein